MGDGIGNGLEALQATTARRDETRPEGSYTAALLAAGRRRITQKVGEEGVEVALAPVAGEAEAEAGA